MKRFFNYIKQDKIIKLCFQIAGVLLLGQLLFIGFSFFSLPPLIPLFNQLPWGEARLANKFTIGIPSGIVIIVLIGNLLLLNTVYEKSPLLARILGITALLISLLACIFTIQTISILL